MRSIHRDEVSRDDIVEVFDALAADLDRALDLSFDALTTPERLAVLQRCEVLRRRLPAVEHPLINQLTEQADARELGGKLRWALSDRLHITRAEAGRRITEAADLGSRHGLTGEALPPLLPDTAAAQRTGELSSAHIQVIREFFAYLPDTTDPDKLTRAETVLADYARRHQPEELAQFAKGIADRLHQDGNYSDDERALRRTLTLGPQGRDGMSAIKGYLDPQARATLEAVWARLAAPGMGNPADDTPCLSGTPSQAAIDNDHRSPGQRQHDALTTIGRAMLASGELGHHNGLPATIIISTSLAELEAGTGQAHTGGGSRLPMTDLIRLAAHSHHYLRRFDGAKELALFHTKRLASPSQRLVLYAKDRGCTHPGCPIPGYLTEVHHHQPYTQTGETDIHGLTFRCHPHHEIITTGGWTTHTNQHGHTETIPPPHLDHGQPRRNDFHHPERLLHHLNNETNETNEDDDGP